MCDGRQQRRRRRRVGHGGFWVQETIGAQHHGLDLEVCGHTQAHTNMHEDASTVFCLSCIEDLRTHVYTLGIQILCDSYQYVFRQGC